MELRDVLQVAEDDSALATQRLRHGVELDLRHVVVDDVVERDHVVCLGLHQLVHDQR